jgi:PPOX class probable FMN-dependent enzyme
MAASPALAPFHGRTPSLCDPAHEAARLDYLRGVFKDRITSIEGLRALIPSPPSDAPAVRKDIYHLDGHCRIFIASSPFLVIASASADGHCDASPRGGPPGFVRVLDDHRLAIPDYPGNRRLDSWTNILEANHVQILFFIPGMLETLRVCGRGCLTRDPDILSVLSDRGRTPVLAFGLDVEVAFLQCGKALKRSALWDPNHWPPRTQIPSAGRIFLDHIELSDLTEADAVEHLAEDYESNLWPKP